MTKRRAVRTRAALCGRFRIPWDQYDRLTVRELSELLTLLEDEQEANPRRPASAAGSKSDRGPGWERVV